MAEKLLDPSFERLLQRGPGALTDTEIVSLLLGNRDSRIASLEMACDLMGIPLVDHLVLSGSRWFSIRRLRPW